MMIVNQLSQWNKLFYNAKDIVFTSMARENLMKLFSMMKIIYWFASARLSIYRVMICYYQFYHGSPRSVTG